MSPDRTVLGTGAAVPSPSPASWALPRATGPYLTGTAGPARLTGIDAARGLALLGMVVAHIGLTSCGLTSPEGLLSLVHGRSSVLFAVIAGFSLGIMTGRTTPHRGARLVSARLRILVRCALLLVLGALCTVLDTSVAIILGFYAAWLALALPFVRLRASVLLALSAVIALIGPVLLITLPAALAELGLTSTAADGNTAVLSFFIYGTYPGLLWMAYILLGLGLSRLDWGRSAQLWRLAGAGALCALLGYGGAVAAGHALGVPEPDRPVVVTPADPSQCSPGIDPSGLPGGSLPGLPGSSGSSGVPAVPPSSDLPPGPTAPVPVPQGDQGAEGTDRPVAEADYGPLSSSHWSSLITARPHANTSFEAVGSSGVAMLVIALAQLIAARSRLVLAPLAAVGSMSLTAYCAHLVVIHAATLTPGSGNGAALVVCLGLVLAAMAWFAVFARGPLEHVVHVISLRATQAD
ncbi:MAG: heparan-alpha-glucosaminide N-acetyltransferase domain-containing protein [Actinomyces bowdenii]|nr:heparan-alpha-glucosaminide N-acetyltransferase domain-containing protein [Actinomyces bowdenii]